MIFAHPGELLTPHDLWSAWTLEPSLLIPLGISVVIYLWGARNAWRRAGRERGITRHRWLSFAGALLALILALVSPLDALSEALFSAHMIQHLVLMLVAAPLLVLSDFPLALLWALPRPWARILSRRLNRACALHRIWQAISGPAPAWLWFTTALWGWHAPALYEAALRSEAIHVVEHLAYLLTAMLFWWVLFRHNGPRELHYGMAIPYLFTTALQSGILGALMTFTSQPWYAYYAPFVATWGLTAMQDQQLAGLIMWLPGGVVFTLLTIGYFAAWLNALEQRSLRQNDSFASGNEHKP